MFTTSGSTGVPKVVPLTFGAVDSFTGWALTQFGIAPGTVVLSYAPLTFDLSLLEIWATLKAGGTAVLVDPERAVSGQYIAELLAARRVGVVQGVPVLYHLLADARTERQFLSVRHAIVTGDTMRAPLLAKMPRMFPNARIYNVYGSTETNDSFMYEAGAELESGAEMPIGRTLPGVDAVIADGDGAIIDGPAAGELLVATPFQSQGYLFSSGPDERFVNLDGRRHLYFRSGDLVRRSPDGLYTLLGRNDRQVKVRGVRVNLDEIERVLVDHPSVVQGAVVALPDDLAGLRIHAVVHGARTGQPDIFALRDHCGAHLARAAIPSKIRVAGCPLPTTPTGKLDRQAILREELMG
jgi:acyl-coenzyme A synthetase/AMP-(fatty) acid ligase